MERPRLSLIILALGFIISLALVVIFTIRGLHAVSRGPVGEPIRPWMSVPYIAHSYRVPPRVLFQALGLPGDRRDWRPIATIAREQNRPVQDVIQILYRTVLENNPAFIPPTPAIPRPSETAP